MRVFNPVVGPPPRLLSVRRAQVFQSRAVGSERVSYCPSSGILYLHGGGLVVVGPDTHAQLCAHLSLRTGNRVIVPDYRLLPEHPFPAPLSDCLNVYERTLKEGVAPEHVALGGDSHGAALGVGMMTALRDRNLPQPSAAFSISGAFDSTLSQKGLSAMDKLDPLLSLGALRLWQQRIQRVTPLDHPQLSPLFSDLEGLAPILLLAGSDDIWQM